MATSDYYIQDNSDIEDKKLEAASSLYKTGNYANALKLYLDLENTSYSSTLCYEIGRCYYKLQNLEKAEKYFLSSISLDEIKNPSYLLLGNVYHKNNDVTKAIEYWQIAYSQKPEEESACINLATSYFTKNMRFQSLIFFEKYIKYAKDKNNSHYLEIKNTIESFANISKDFYQKARTALSMKDTQTAIQCLEYATKNYPIDFDVNFTLGKLYYQEKEYLKSLAYLKQAYCLDRKSLDILELLATVMLNLGDYTSAYCCLKRILPLIINNQKEYLEILKSIKQLETGFDKYSSQSHLNLADEYYNNNNYPFSLFEYENCLILDNSISDKISDKIQKIRSFINPEERIIKLCYEKGGTSYSNKDFRNSNKYFSRIMTLSETNSSDYRFAKSRLVDV